MTRSGRDCTGTSRRRCAGSLSWRPSGFEPNWSLLGDVDLADLMIFPRKAKFGRVTAQEDGEFLCGLDHRLGGVGRPGGADGQDQSFLADLGGRFERIGLVE